MTRTQIPPSPSSPKIPCQTQEEGTKGTGSSAVNFCLVFTNWQTQSIVELKVELSPWTYTMMSWIFCTCSACGMSGDMSRMNQISTPGIQSENWRGQFSTLHIFHSCFRRFCFSTLIFYTDLYHFFGKKMGVKFSPINLNCK